MHPFWRTISLALLAAILLTACTKDHTFVSPTPANGYYDPHNHLSGVLPYQAYADLPAYIKKLEGKGKGVARADKLAFYTWLDDTWYNQHREGFGDQPFSSGMRFGLGARATLELYPPRENMPTSELNGALERIFTATPFTEFDSAYAFHEPAYTWLARTYYAGDRTRGSEDLCTAQVLELAREHITRSEQSISFIGGWDFDSNGHSFNLAKILCVARKPAQLKETFARLQETPPRVRIILMTHTDQLAENQTGDAYKTFEGTGQCHWQPLPRGLKLSPRQMYHALLGEDKKGHGIVPPDARKAFFRTLVGIDTAAPESTCFTPAGMAYYRELVGAVYRAAQARRDMGWNGKLLVHTHVGEGFTYYYARQQPSKPWTFQSVFSKVPVLDGNVVSNAQAPRNNITMLLDAVAHIRDKHPDLDRYIVIRFGHVTHATLAQARRMARLHVEADVNLDSNIATGAWSFTQMPRGKSLGQRVAIAAADPKTNFELNDLSAFLVPDPHKAKQVAAVFGTYPLKHLLMAHVRVLLGTDGAGVEHSSMPREYALATSLVRYWKNHDPAFAKQAGNASTQTFFNNARWHLANMAGNQALSY